MRVPRRVQETRAIRRQRFVTIFDAFSARKRFSRGGKWKAFRQLVDSPYTLLKRTLGRA